MDKMDKRELMNDLLDDTQFMCLSYIINKISNNLDVLEKEDIIKVFNFYARNTAANTKVEVRNSK